MTFVAVKPPSIISVIHNGTCSNLSGTGKLSYEVGKNTANELFIRISSYENEATTPCPHYWFAIFDLSQLFVLANGGHVSSFEPFDGNSLQLQSITNNTASAFLKAILCDAMK